MLEGLTGLQFFFLQSPIALETHFLSYCFPFCFNIFSLLFIQKKMYIKYKCRLGGPGLHLPIIFLRLSTTSDLSHFGLRATRASGRFSPG